MKGNVFVAAVGVVVCSSVAAASEPPPEAATDHPVSLAVADRPSPSDRAVSLPREPRTTAPRGSRSADVPGSLVWSFGSTGFHTALPLGSTAGNFDGRAGRLGLAWAKDGHRYLWTVDATASLGTPAATRDNVPASKASTLRARGAALLPLGSSFAAGLAAEVSANAIGSIQQGDEYVTTWQTVVAGAQVRARLPLSSRLSLSADGFAGASPLAGHYDAIDTASRHNASGAFGLGGVLAGSAALSLRTGDRFALSAGVSARAAQLGVGKAGALAEHELTPFVSFGRAF